MGISFPTDAEFSTAILQTLTELVIVAAWA